MANPGFLVTVWAFAIASGIVVWRVLLSLFGVLLGLAALIFLPLNAAASVFLARAGGRYGPADTGAGGRPTASGY
jgi:hypothetical protein